MTSRSGLTKREEGTITIKETTMISDPLFENMNIMAIEMPDQDCHRISSEIKVEVEAKSA
jgi:hypothetical protein